MCTHSPPCPPATAPDHAGARLVVHHDGWSLLCNHVVVDDTGELLPDGTAVAPHRHRARHRPALAS